MIISPIIGHFISELVVTLVERSRYREDTIKAIAAANERAATRDKQPRDDYRHHSLITFGQYKKRQRRNGKAPTARNDDEDQ